MIDTLLTEERMIVDCLQRYHALKKEQLIKLIQYKGYDVSLRILKSLEKKQIIMGDGNYYSADIRCTVDDDMVKAFWVLLEFAGRIDRGAHFRAQYPGKIRFLSGNREYEIVVINDNDISASQLNFLFSVERDCSDAEEDIPVFLIVIPDTDYIDECVKRIPQNYIENNHIIFVTVSYKYPSDDYPKVDFFSASI